MNRVVHAGRTCEKYSSLSTVCWYYTLCTTVCIHTKLVLYTYEQAVFSGNQAVFSAGRNPRLSFRAVVLMYRGDDSSETTVG